VLGTFTLSSDSELLEIGTPPPHPASDKKAELRLTAAAILLTGAVAPALRKRRPIPEYL